jgi:predicted nucleic acid-binding protein
MSDRRYLIDTNALSEPQRPRPDPHFMAFVQALPDEVGFVSVISLGELRKGIVKLSPGRRRDALQTWLDQTRSIYRERTIDIDADIVLRWGALTAELEARGRNLKPADGLIAATALCRSLTVMTRNVRDFDDTGVETVNPWDEAAEHQGGMV